MDICFYNLALLKALGDSSKLILNVFDYFLCCLLIRGRINDTENLGNQFSISILNRCQFVNPSTGFIRLFALSFTLLFVFSLCIPFFFIIMALSFLLNSGDNSISRVRRVLFYFLFLLFYIALCFLSILFCLLYNLGRLLFMVIIDEISTLLFLLKLTNFLFISVYFVVGTINLRSVTV